MSNWLSKGKKGNILNQHGLRCYYCYRPLFDPAGMQPPPMMNEKGEYRLCFDHVKPRKHGGSSDADNIVPCCWRCNSVKRDKELLDIDCGG